MELNKDIETRDKLIWGKYRPRKYNFGGVIPYQGMNVRTLRKLLEQNFADPEERQNNAPTIGEIYNFMKSYPSYTCHGYAVSADRDDYRVSIEGVEKGDKTDSVEEFQSYMKLFGNADEINFNTMYCWFN